MSDQPQHQTGYVSQPFSFQPQQSEAQTLEQLTQERERLKNIDAQLDKQVAEGEFGNSTQFLSQQQTQSQPGSHAQSQSDSQSHSHSQPIQLDPSIPAPLSDAERRDQDSRSIYIGNVDYLSTPLELQQHFSSAGIVNRVTILMNKLTGQPKGFAYLEFSDVDGVNKAVATLDGTMFRERELKVMAKRTNIPGISVPRGSLRGRGRGGIMRGGRGGGFRGGRGMRGGRGGFRGNTRFNPY
ncbi:hypothetical protein KGF54_005288 [Candida jiufengensis]|uniref:uncharacterized protein n=1 Tax=Candida jiufengensis TaxID=497108 RepID=UPI00222581D6|nr:uncharacterized protein KGF54_005288 [Candida jiufengensis]KAI5950140.1 hypothetical protein KGF54_005288 [Candida jiufengensis]